MKMRNSSSGKWARMCVTALVASLGVVAVSGCAANGDPNAVQYQGIVLGTTAGTTCTYTAGGQTMQSGVLDLAATSTYQIAAVLRNGMPPSNGYAGANPNNSDTNTIIFDYADVQLSSGDPLVEGSFPRPTVKPRSAFFATSKDTSAPSEAKTAKPPAKWRTPMSGSVKSGGIEAFLLDLVPAYGMDTTSGVVSAAIGEQWQARFAGATNTTDFTRNVDIVLQVQFHGNTASGSSITSVPVTFPLRVCWGCLMDPVDQNGTGTDVWNSCSSRVTGDTFTRPCRAGQDDPLNCAYYCQRCNVESIGYKKCDATYCPDL